MTLFTRRWVSGKGGGCILAALFVAVGGWVDKHREGDLHQARASFLHSSSLLTVQGKGEGESRKEVVTAPLVTEEPILSAMSALKAWPLW